jgi:hypothetical protein
MRGASFLELRLAVQRKPFISSSRSRSAPFKASAIASLRAISPTSSLALSVYGSIWVLNNYF